VLSQIASLSVVLCPSTLPMCSCLFQLGRRSPDLPPVFFRRHIGSPTAEFTFWRPPDQPKNPSLLPRFLRSSSLFPLSAFLFPSMFRPSRISPRLFLVFSGSTIGISWINPNFPWLLPTASPPTKKFQLIHPGVGVLCSLENSSVLLLRVLPV